MMAIIHPKYRAHDQKEFFIKNSYEFYKASGELEEFLINLKMSKRFDSLNLT